MIYYVVFDQQVNEMAAIGELHACIEATGTTFECSLS